MACVCVCVCVCDCACVGASVCHCVWESMRVCDDAEALVGKFAYYRTVWTCVRSYQDRLLTTDMLESSPENLAIGFYWLRHVQSMPALLEALL